MVRQGGGAGQRQRSAQPRLPLRDWQGVAQDFKAAAAWYAKAAVQGNAGAQFSLGVLFKNGTGVAQDFKTAAAWCTASEAAAQGFSDAAALRDECLELARAAAPGAGTRAP